MKMKIIATIGLLLGVITVIACGTGDQPARQDIAPSVAVPEIDGVFAYKVGQFEIFTLVEVEREGNTSILLDADADLLSRYIPETGFLLPINAFLIKAQGRNILVDAGTGADGGIMEKINMLGVDPANIDTLLITHLHFDHFGGIQTNGTANFPNAKVYVSEKDIEYFTVTNVNKGAVDALATYGDQVVTFDPGELGSSLTELLPGITPIANYGHTPGHTVFLVESGNDKFIIAGDFLHVGLVQFPNPDISATFDVDPKAAAVSRRQIIGYAASNNIPIGGMHIAYPGIGTVEADGTGYGFTPVR